MTPALPTIQILLVKQDITVLEVCEHLTYAHFLFLAVRLEKHRSSDLGDQVEIPVCCTANC